MALALISRWSLTPEKKCPEKATEIQAKKAPFKCVLTERIFYIYRSFSNILGLVSSCGQGQTNRKCDGVYPTENAEALGTNMHLRSRNTLTSDASN